MHACFVFVLDSVVSLAGSRSLLERFFVPIAASIGISNFFCAF